jgi:hypothetical protein
MATNNVKSFESLAVSSSFSQKRKRKISPPSGPSLTVAPPSFSHPSSLTKKPVSVISSPTDRNAKRKSKQQEKEISKLRLRKFLFEPQGFDVVNPVKLDPQALHAVRTASVIASEFAEAVADASETVSKIRLPNSASVQAMGDGLSAHAKALDNSFDTISANLPGLIEALMKACSTIESDNVSELASAINSFAKVADHRNIFKVTQTLNDTLASIKTDVKSTGLLKSVFHISSIPVLLAIAGSATISLISEHSVAAYVILAISLGLLVIQGCFMEFPDAFSMLYGYFSRCFEPSPQFDQGDLESVASIISTSIFGCFLFDAKTKKPLTEKFMSAFALFDKGKKSILDVFNLFLKGFEWVVNILRKECFDMPSVRFVHENNAEIDRYLGELCTFQDKVDQNELYINMENFENLKYLIARGNQILSGTPRDAGSVNICTRLMGELTKLERLREKFIAADYRFEGLRQEPVGVLFRGGPGTGKSISMEQLYTAIAQRLLSPDKLEQFKRNPATFVYNRQSETVHWDGYDHNKLVTYFDDFGQQKDVPGNPDNEYMNLIRAINGFQYNLHIAAMSGKGVTTFSSKFVLCSTNIVKFEPESIISPEALMRRFAKIYVVVPRPEYCLPGTESFDVFNRKYDYSRLPKVETSLGETSHLSVHTQHFIEHTREGKEIGPPRTFDEVVETLLSLERERRMWHEIQLRDLKDTAARYARPPEPDIQLSDLDAVPQMKRPSVPSMPRSIILRKSGNLLTELPLEVQKFYFEMFPESLHSSGYDAEQLDTCYKLARIFISAYSDGFSSVNRQVMFACLYKDFGYDFCSYLVHPDTDLVTESNFRFSTPRSWFSAYGSVKCDVDFKPFTEAKESLLVHSIKCLDKWLQNNPFVAYVGDLRRIVYPIVFGILGLATGGFVENVFSSIYKFVRSLFSKEDSDSGFTGQSFGNSDKMHSRRGAARRIAAKHSSKPHMSGNFDPSGTAFINSIVKRNCYMMSCEDNLGSGNFCDVQGYATFVRGSIMLIPFHFVTVFDSHVEKDPSLLDLKVKLAREKAKVVDMNNREFCYIVTLRDILSGIIVDDDMQECDTILVNLSHTKIPPHRDIVSHFIDADTPRVNTMFRMVFPNYLNKESFTGSGRFGSNKSVSDSGEGYTIKSYFNYSATTVIGDCGALVTELNPSSPSKKIIGIHVAGCTALREGVSAVVTSTMLTDALKDFHTIIADEPSLTGDSDTVISQGQFSTLGVVVPAPRRVRRTNLKRSRLYQKWSKSLYKPAHLETFRGPDGDEINPIDLTLAKYCPPPVYISDVHVRFLAIRVLQHLRINSKIDVEPRIFTFEEAVCGLEYDADYGSLDRSTSAGYPYNCDGKGSNKKRFFGPGPLFDLDSNESLLLRAKVKSDNSLRSMGQRVAVLWTDNFKDEILKSEKVDKGKLRMINGGPVEFVIETRQYFGSFCLWILKNRISNGCAIGVNPYSSEWDTLARKLTKFFDGPRHESPVGAGDFSGFDATELPSVHYGILDVINEWYDDEHSLTRKVMWLELVSSYHVLDGVVYQWPSSLPSGYPLTSLVNCLYNHFAFQHCWAQEVGITISFSANVYLCVMGDDNIFHVSSEYRDIFTELCVQKHMKAFGLTYTPEQKDDEFGQWRTISDVEFLKRGFRWNEKFQVFVAPWRLECLLESPYWVINSASQVDSTIQKVYSCLRELSLHDEDTFNKWAPLMLKHVHKCYPEADKSLLVITDYSSLQVITGELEEWY